MTRSLLLLLVLAWPVAASAASEKVYRLGELEPTATSLEFTHRVTMPELAKLGFAEGRNLIVDQRIGDAAAMPEWARELVRASPDVIIAVGPDAMRLPAKPQSPIVTFDSIRYRWAWQRASCWLSSRWRYCGTSVATVLARPSVRVRADR
jgi:putative ABC transport system substrate-binding protein